MALKFRRGTTAQQSGSLAFGEPYVNTTLGTLVVGGQTGDIVLSTSGTGSTGNFGAISGSGLDITGNANIAGNVTIGGQLQVGDQTSDTINVVASLSSSLIPQTTNAFDLGSASKIWRDLYISTGSIKFVDGTSVVGTFDLNSYNSLKTSTGSANVSLTNLNAFTSSQLTQNSALATYTSSVEGRFTTLATLTGSNAIRLTNLETTSASVNTSISNLNTFSGSQLTQNSALATISGSLISSASADRVSITNINTTTASLNTSVSNINSFTASQLTQNSALATISGSLISSASNLTQRVAANEAVSGTFARTNSANTFNGTQTVSGSLYVTQDLVVQGSSSIQNISSSNLVIGAAYVTVNTNSPSSRYAGLIIVDSGSAGGSGSFFYDSVDDEMIFVHKGNGVNITSSQVLMGPETYDNLGNESYLTRNRILKGGGYEHVADSQITDDGTTVSIVGNLDLTGSMKAAQLTAIATYTGSVEGRFTTLASLTGSNLVRLTNLETTSASVNTSIANINVATASLQTTSASVNTSVTNINTTTASLNTSVTNLNSYTSSFAAASVTLTNKTISGASNTLSNIGNSSLTNSSITIAGTSTALGGTITLATITGGSSIFSGSTQIPNTSIQNAQLANSTISGIALGSNLATLTIGTGLSGTSYNGSGAVTIANTGVTSFNTRTGAVTLAATDISSLGASIVSGSSISSPAQGQVTLTTNGVAATAVNLGLQTSSSPTFAGLTINGAITATGDITAYYSSDIRFKDNVVVIGDALDKVKKLRGVKWEWNDTANDVTKAAPNTGLIAQEVQQVLPEVVKQREDGFLGLDYAKMVGLLVEAIKEQQQYIDNLTIQVEELKKQKGL